MVSLFAESNFAGPERLNLASSSDDSSEDEEDDSDDDHDHDHDNDTNLQIINQPQDLQASFFQDQGMPNAPELGARTGNSANRSNNDAMVTSELFSLFCILSAKSIR